jgi:hypothetical protein
MSLAGTVRSAVATADKVVKALEEEVTHEAWISADMFGKNTYAAPALRKALVEQKIQERRLSDGRIVKTSAKLTFLEVIPANGTAGRIEPIDPRDRITLKDGTTGPILSDSGFRDPEKSRPYLVEILLGL